MIRIDCPSTPSDCPPDYAQGIVCMNSSKASSYQLCRRANGFSTDWLPAWEQIFAEIVPHLKSGAINGIFIGDELTPLGMTYGELKMLVDAVAASVGSLGLPGIIIWYNDSDNFHLWEGDIPHNLTIFSG